MVLVMFITMLFVYYFLAKKEEKECENKFGEDFRNYVEKTSMFIPGDSYILKRLPSLPASGIKRFAAILLLFLWVMGLSLIAGFGLRNYSISSISTLYSRDAATISTVLLNKEDMENILEIALKHPEVKQKLARAGYGTGKNY
jgi:predicted PurR-regulated permease PerM